jgi:hypothetical protein
VMLYYKKIRIGRGVFVGALTRVGPGCEIGDLSVVPTCTDLFVNEKKAAGDFKQ